MGGWVCIKCQWYIQSVDTYKKLGHFLLLTNFFDCNQAILSLGEDGRSAASDPNTEQYTSKYVYVA
jgi:hypothetical protein